MHGLIQRKKGGQPGNQNARIHGFYSKALSHEEKCDLKYASGVDGLDQEIAILRIKFRSLLSHDGQNVHLLNQTAETLARLYSIKFSLSKNDTSKLKQAVTAALEDFIIPGPGDSQIQSPAQSPDPVTDVSSQT